MTNNDLSERCPLSPVARAARRVSVLLICVALQPLSFAARADDARPADAARPANPARSGEPPCGRFDERGAYPILSLWGTPAERGFAQGYFLAERIKRLMISYLDAAGISGGPKKYEELLQKYLRPPVIITGPRVRAELGAMVEGIERRLGRDGMQIPALGRAIGVGDLLAFNFASDTLGLACSSFAVWGEHTADGKLIAGRNLDWLWTPEIAALQHIVVHAADGNRPGWVAVTWPGCTGVFTGMNEQGVTAAMHDVPGRNVFPPVGITSRCLLLRELLERTAADTPVDDVVGLFSRYKIGVGTNIMMCRPSTAPLPAGVFEYDGFKEQAGGLTLRAGATAQQWLACTNHYRQRSAGETFVAVSDSDAGRCDRYDELVRRIERARNRRQPVDAASGWKLLTSVCQTEPRPGGCHTLHSALFEPDARRMHVALSAGERSAGDCEKVTLDVARLIADAHP